MPSKVVSGYGPFDTDPEECWDVVVEEFATIDEAKIFAEELYEGNLAHPDSQYYWVIVLEDGEKHPVLPQTD